jgi:hypothetical protein
MGVQQRQNRRRDGDASLSSLPGLRGPLHHPRLGCVDDRTEDAELARGEVDVGPSERHQLAASGAGVGRQAQVQPELFVGGVEQDAQRVPVGRRDGVRGALSAAARTSPG